MKIVTIIGARPQFIKAATVSREILSHNEIIEVIVHTGQHFDANMSDVFFEQMHIPKPDYNLDIHGLGHGAMTGQMLEKIESVLLKEKPNWVIVYGDTNSTLAGALAAKKLHIKVAHIEAGLRSFNMKMPEEINRILTDRISDILFCPTETAITNLKQEGYENIDCKIENCGDVMLDAATFYSELSKKPDFDIPNQFILATVHRAENTDDIDRLKAIFNALAKISEQIEIILPLHPRTKAILQKNRINTNFITTEPLGYLEMVYLLQKCALVMTDSGGLQKEAYFFKKKCVTLREETEWVELVKYNFNLLAGTNEVNIIEKFKQAITLELDFDVNLYGDGYASQFIINTLKNYGSMPY